MTAEEVGKIIRERGINFSTFFFDPPYPKYWRYAPPGCNAAFVIYYEPDTKLAVARAGYTGRRLHNVYYIGKIEEYSTYQKTARTVEYAVIEQESWRKNARTIHKWQEPVVKKRTDECPDYLFDQVMEHLTNQVGQTGWPMNS